MEYAGLGGCYVSLFTHRGCWLLLAAGMDLSSPFFNLNPSNIPIYFISSTLRHLHTIFIDINHQRTMFCINIFSIFSLFLFDRRKGGEGEEINNTWRGSYDNLKGALFGLGGEAENKIKRNTTKDENSQCQNQCVPRN